MAIRYPPTLTDPPVGSGVWCHLKKKNTPNKEVKTSTDLHQGQQIQKTKRNDIRKALERDRRFSRSLKAEKLSKKSTRGFSFKDGVVRQKSAHKNFIKKVVVWGFLSAMREKREGNGKKPWRNVCAFVRVCVFEHTNVCKWGLSLRHLDFSGWANNSWEGKQNWDVWLGRYRQGRRRGWVRLRSSPLLHSKRKEKQKRNKNPVTKRI